MLMCRDRIVKARSLCLLVTPIRRGKGQTLFDVLNIVHCRGRGHEEAQLTFLGCLSRIGEDEVYYVRR